MLLFLVKREAVMPKIDEFTFSMQSEVESTKETKQIGSKNY
jgi:hypothetical protein